MHMLGRWNWWAPKPLVWLHDRIGLHEGENLADRNVQLRGSGLHHAER
jgi:putative drug exporter of the RND superfamily